MKYLNDKIKNFIEWCKDQEHPILIPSLRWFYLYQKENEGIKNLTDEEEQYLKIYAQEQAVMLMMVKQIPTDVGKFILQNDYQWDQKQKLEIDKIFEGIKFIGLK